MADNTVPAPPQTSAQPAAQGLPHSNALRAPVLLALRKFSEPVARPELVRAVAAELGISEELLALPRYLNTQSPKKFAHRVGWALTMLKLHGLAINNSSARWRATDYGQTATLEAIEKPATQVYSYLFAYNPKQYDWQQRGKLKAQLAEGLEAEQTWTCSLKHIPEGSTCYLIQLGEGNKGLFARGYSKGAVHQAPHRDAEKAKQGKTQRRVTISFEEILDTPALDWETLHLRPFHDYFWSINGSGVAIPPNISDCIAQIWAAEEQIDAVRAAVSSRPRAWIFTPGAHAADLASTLSDQTIAIGWHEMGDLQSFTTRHDLKQRAVAEPGATPTKPDVAACWNFCRNLAVGDTLLLKQGADRIVALGTVTSDYRYEPSKAPFGHQRSAQFDRVGSWQIVGTALAQKTLAGYALEDPHIRALLRIVNSDPASSAETVPTNKAEAGPRPFPQIAEPSTERASTPAPFVKPADIEAALRALRARKNLILRGAPGVGKTFIAKVLAKLLVGSGPQADLEWVQFHQAYAYEDFVQGWRPAADKPTFCRQDGLFLRLCEQAATTHRPTVLVIDEINRCNLSGVMGELLLLLEVDKRGPEHALRLCYSKEGEPKFWVPDNLYIIGTMNTADLSLASFDFALRRRFSFMTLAPAFDDHNFHQHLIQRGLSAAFVSQLAANFRQLNDTIGADSELGPGFFVGHSYFCGEVAIPHPGAWLADIVQFNIAPLLQEYWADRPSKWQQEIAKLSKGLA